MFVVIASSAYICYELYQLELKATAALEQQNEQLTVTKKELDVELSAYKERKAFWQENKPYFDYQDAAQLQANQTYNWDSLLSAMEDALPQGGQIFHLEVHKRSVQGLGVVHTIDGVAAFMQKMQQDPLVDAFMLEVVNAPKAFAPLYIETEQATVFRFQFKAAEPEQSDSEDGGTSDET